MENKAESGFLFFNDVLSEESKILCSGGVLFSIFFCTFYDSVFQTNIYCCEIVFFPVEMSVIEIFKVNVLIS